MKMMVFLTFFFTPTEGGDEKKVVAYGEIEPLPMSCVQPGECLDFGLEKLLFEVEDICPPIIRNGKSWILVNCGEIDRPEEFPLETFEQTLKTFFLPDTLKIIDFESVDAESFDIRTLLPGL